MAIEFVCPACGGTLQVGDESAGRAIRCGGCLTALKVPEAGSAPPNPYEVDRPAPPPPAPARSTPTDPEPSAAIPVEPRRRRDPDDPFAPPARRRRDPDDPFDDRPRRHRPPPQPAGTGVFFWLVIIGAVMLLGVVGCCGALFLAVPGAKWHKHESAKGGFRVELPAKARDTMNQDAGIKLDRGTKAEGTVLLRPPKQFVVFYRDVPGTQKRAGVRPPETDEQLTEREIEAVRAALQSGPPVRSEPVKVGGFDGREAEFVAPTGHFTVRVVVADTRVFVLLAGGGVAQPDDADVRRFLDSFEITDPALVTEGKRRAEQAQWIADAAKEAKEREAQRKEAENLRDAAGEVAGAALAEALHEARVRREAEELRVAVGAVTTAALTTALNEARIRRETEALRSAAEAVAGAALGTALREAAAPRLPVAPPPRPVGD